jgi:hypothetical protein
MRGNVPDRARFLPVALVALALATAVGVAILLRGAPPTDVSSDAGARALRTALFWVLAYIAAVVMFVWNAFVSITIIRAHMTRRSMRIVSVIAGGAMVVMFLIAVAGSADSRSVWLAIDAATRSSLHTTSWLTGTLAGGVFVLIVAACVSLVTPSDKASTADQLRRRMAEARLILFSTAALVSAVLTSIYLTVVWPSTLMSRSGPTMNANILTHLAVTFTLAEGIAFTGALVLLFVPVALIHEMWIEEAWESAHKDAPDQKRSSWLTENGLDQSIASSSAQIIALAAPWLAAVGLPKLH